MIVGRSAMHNITKQTNKNKKTTVVTTVKINAEEKPCLLKKTNFSRAQPKHVSSSKTCTKLDDCLTKPLSEITIKVVSGCGNKNISWTKKSVRPNLFDLMPFLKGTKKLTKHELAVGYGFNDDQIGSWCFCFSFCSKQKLTLLFVFPSFRGNVSDLR